MNFLRFLGVLFLFCGGVVAAAQSADQSGAKPISLPQDATLPAWPRLNTFPVAPDLPVLRSGDLEIVHGKTPVAGFLVRVADRTVAIGSAPARIGYISEDELRWLNCEPGSNQTQSVLSRGSSIESRYEYVDPEGGRWHITQEFRPGRIAAAIDVQTDVMVDKDRQVAFLPMLLLFPGAGSFAASKGQGLFAGLEYLDNEPSSSEADIIGPASKRAVPDNLKITMPLMAIQGDGRYVAVTWQMRPQFSALFDSPDRVFGSGLHVMGLLFPGSDGKNRVDGNPLPRVAELLHGGQIVSLRATIFGGLGTSVVPAVQHYVRLRPLPPLPAALDRAGYLSAAAGGWLDSKIREDNLVRHAVAAGGFKAQPAADAGLWMEWLATQIASPATAEQLNETATNILSAVSAESWNSAGVGHIRYPVQTLVFGKVAENAEQAGRSARALLSRFEPDGSVKYKPLAGGIDYAKTHFTNEASGLASRVVVDLLEAAAFAGDRQMLDTGLSRLRDLNRFHDGVPRGAQTWECPLHIPDILASAQMMRAYTLGYQLTGDAQFLSEARYWAWTGVPFIYLVNPTEAPVGLYATIAVFGATNWKAPVWLGLPVQWCGLVYADALYRLASQDSHGPWKQIADGVTLSGIQQSWPQDDHDYHGLLPDSFILRNQKRNGPAINPATLQACATRYFSPIPVCDFRCFRTAGLLVFAPGEIRDVKESKSRLAFQVQSWVKHPYFILINGFARQPRVKVDGRTVDCSPPDQFVQEKGRLILQLKGAPSVAIEF